MKVMNSLSREKEMLSLYLLNHFYNADSDALLEAHFEVLGIIDNCDFVAVPVTEGQNIQH